MPRNPQGVQAPHRDRTRKTHGLRDEISTSTNNQDKTLGLETFGAVDNSEAQTTETYETTCLIATYLM